jgi:hypothetical protein
MTNLVKDLLFHGSSLTAKLEEALVESSVELSITQVSQFTLTFSDPGYTILNSGFFKLGGSVSFYDYNLTTSVIETTTGNGEGGFKVTFRPTAVYKLRRLTGKLHLKKVSPSQYVHHELRRANVPVGYIQPSFTRKAVARDVKQPATQYDTWSYPSAWTTFERLAPELGFTVYEMFGKVYFGWPTTIANTRPQVPIAWYASGNNEPLNFPECRRSLDSLDTDITLTVPTHRRGEMVPGNRLSLSGIPTFNGQYLITNVTYALHDESPITVTASTLRNPVATGDPDK